MITAIIHGNKISKHFHNHTQTHTHTQTQSTSYAQEQTERQMWRTKIHSSAREQIAQTNDTLSFVYDHNRG